MDKQKVKLIKSELFEATVNQQEMQLGDTVGDFDCRVPSIYPCSVGNGKRQKVRAMKGCRQGLSESLFLQGKVIPEKGSGGWGAETDWRPPKTAETDLASICET